MSRSDSDTYMYKIHTYMYMYIHVQDDISVNVIGDIRQDFNMFKGKKSDMSLTDIINLKL